MTEPTTAPATSQPAPEAPTAELEGAALMMAESVSLPGAGQRAVVPTGLGTSYAFPTDQVSLAQEGPSLVVSTETEGEVVLEDFFVLAGTDLPPSLTLADGTVITADAAIDAIEGFDADAIATAAGGGAGGGGGGASFGGFDPGTLGDGLDQSDLVGNLELVFNGAPVAPEPETVPLFVSLSDPEPESEDDSARGQEPYSGQEPGEEHVATFEEFAERSGEFPYIYSGYNELNWSNTFRATGSERYDSENGFTKGVYSGTWMAFNDWGNDTWIDTARPKE